MLCAVGLCALLSCTIRVPCACINYVTLLFHSSIIDISSILINDSFDTISGRFKCNRTCSVAVKYLSLSFSFSLLFFENGDFEREGRVESIWPREVGDFIHVAGVPEGVKSCRDLSLTLQFARFESNQGTNYITSDAFLSVLSRYLFPPSYRKSSKGNTVHHGLCAITRETIVSIPRPIMI